MTFPRFWAVLLAIGLSGCAGTGSSELARCSPAEDPAGALLELHERERQAHLAGRVDMMSVDWAAELVTARGGDLATVSRNDLVARFGTYFEQVRYLEWADLAPPAIRVSPAGEMAWMAVRIRGRLVQKDGNPAEQEVFTSSWIATYERAGCKWLMTGISSDVEEASDESPQNEN